MTHELQRGDGVGVPQARRLREALPVREPPVRCGISSCFRQDIVGYVHDTEKDPERVWMVPLCESCIKAAATVPEYAVHLFRKHKVPEEYRWDAGE